MPKQDEDKPPLIDYGPVKTGWQRSEELEDGELERCGRRGIVITAIVVLIALSLPFIFSLFR